MGTKTKDDFMENLDVWEQEEKQSYAKYFEVMVLVIPCAMLQNSFSMRNWDSRMLSVAHSRYVVEQEADLRSVWIDSSFHCAQTFLFNKHLSLEIWQLFASRIMAAGHFSKDMQGRRSTKQSILPQSLNSLKRWIGVW